MVNKHRLNARMLQKRTAWVVKFCAPFFFDGLTNETRPNSEAGRWAYQLGKK
jgi:hypothetical protein